MKFTSAFTVLACAFVAHASTVANVLTDIGAINTGVTNLNTLINNFANPGGTLAQGLAIHTAAGPVVTEINNATTDTKNVTPLPVSLADGTSILNAATNLKPPIITALTNIVAKKPAFVALPVGGLPALIKLDLTNLNTATTAFEVALIAKAPASLQASASSLTSSINAAFATAIAAYS